MQKTKIRIIEPEDNCENLDIQFIYTFRKQKADQKLELKSQKQEILNRQTEFRSQKVGYKYQT